MSGTADESTNEWHLLLKGKNEWMGNRVPARRRRLPARGPGLRLGQQEKDRDAACAPQLPQDVFDGCPALLVDQVLKRTRVKVSKLNNICNNTMVAVENMTSPEGNCHWRSESKNVATKSRHSVGALLKNWPGSPRATSTAAQEVPTRQGEGAVSNPMGTSSTQWGTPRKMKPGPASWELTRRILYSDLNQAVLTRVHWSPPHVRRRTPGAV